MSRQLTLSEEVGLMLLERAEQKAEQKRRKMQVKLARKMKVGARS